MDVALFATLLYCMSHSWETFFPEQNNIMFIAVSASLVGMLDGLTA